MTLSDSEDNVFARAAVEGLHSPPVEPTGPTSRGNRAWVVFNGRNVGVFETWYVLLIENYLLLRNVHVREATAAQVNGFPSGVQRGYNSYNEAQSAWLHSRANNTVGPPVIIPSASIPAPVVPARSLTPPPLAMWQPGTTRPSCGNTPVLSLSSQTVGPQNLSPGKAVPVTHPSSGVSHPLFSVSTPPRRADSLFRPRIHTPLHPMALSDEDAYWVVTRGEHPGVYHGRYTFSTSSTLQTKLIGARVAASAALGHQGDRRVIKVGSCDQADRAFTNQYMQGDIDEIVDLDALEAAELAAQ